MRLGLAEAMPRTGAGERAAQALLREHTRPNTWIAREARCDPGTVATMRQRLGLPWAGKRPVGSSNPGAGQRALAELRANPSRTLREVAQAAGCAHPTVLRSRRVLERAAAQRAEAAWRALCLRQPERPLVPCQPYMPRPVPEFPRGWHRESPAALNLCRRYCPILAHCRDWALSQPPAPGVLGGLTLRERQAARR
jgi:hypothetical protein